MRGKSWQLISDPNNPGSSGIPHLPRPRYAYFDHEPSKSDVNLYLGTQGRGVWRISFKTPTWNAVEGKISFLRLQALGSGYGAPPDRLDAELIVRVATAPDIALGLKLRVDKQEAANSAMAERLRDAFAENRTVRIEYERAGLRRGLIKRVIEIVQ